MFKEIFNFIFWCMMTLSLGSFLDLRDRLKLEAANAHIHGTLELGKWARKLDNPPPHYQIGTGYEQRN
jgi:hypothetical protein